MIRARCLRVRQQYSVQKNNQKKRFSWGTTAVRRDELYSAYVGPFSRGEMVLTILLNENLLLVLKQHF